MRILKKLLVRIILLIVAAGILCGSVVAVLGYLMYRDALKEQNLEDKVAEVQADPSYTPLADLPEIYLDAVVAVEDHRFEQHCGVDIIAIARAAWNNIKSWSLREGGSTITQQLAKNLYFTQERSFIRKAAEVFMAFRLEQTYSKDEILELYVNSIYFGSGYYNVRQASEGYFGKAPAQMTPYECTLLAGVPNAPSAYDPAQNPGLARQRQKKGGGADGGAGLSERRPGSGGADAGLSTGKPAGAAEPAKRRASRRRAFLLRGARRFSRRAKHSFRFSPHRNKQRE